MYYEKSCGIYLLTVYTVYTWWIDEWGKSSVLSVLVTLFANYFIKRFHSGEVGLSGVSSATWNLLPLIQNTSSRVCVNILRHLKISHHLNWLPTYSDFYYVIQDTFSYIWAELSGLLWFLFLGQISIDIDIYFFFYFIFQIKLKSWKMFKNFTLKYMIMKNIFLAVIAVRKIWK